jgi:hypothetical protein
MSSRDVESSLLNVNNTFHLVGGLATFRADLRMRQHSLHILHEINEQRGNGVQIRKEHTGYPKKMYTHYNTEY